MRISSVEKNSIACELGIMPGDELLTIGGYTAEDILDYEYYSGFDEIVFEISRNGDITEYEIEKDPDEVLGLVFDEDFGIKECRNKCIFCFVDQLPKTKLRESLYVKDDDYRHSFAAGNYVTLTNAGDKELERIIRLSLSPLYISVHTVDNALRAKMLGVKRIPDIMDQLTRLHAAGIVLHCQIVYCPGFNDDIENSIEVLSRYAKSLAIVPVGLTKCGNPELTAVGQDHAEKIIDITEKWQKRLLDKIGTRFVFASDEFYLRAGRNVPVLCEYEGFPQIENGVGLLAQFRDEFLSAEQAYLSDGPKSGGKLSDCIIATGVSAFSFISEHAERISKLSGRKIKVYKIINDFFGESVTVAGLVTGGDLLKQLRGKDLGEILYLPKTMLREFGDEFLDNMKISELGERLNINIRLLPPDGESFFKGLLEINDETE